MDNAIVNRIYKDIFLHIEHGNIDLFLCGGASDKKHISNRDQLRRRLESNSKISIFYPEDMFMELLSRKKYDLLTLEGFLADNSDLILIVCESPGSFAELGAFVNNERTLNKVVVLIQTKYKNAKSFIMQGPVRYVQSRVKKMLFISIMIWMIWSGQLKSIWIKNIGFIAVENIESLHQKQRTLT